MILQLKILESRNKDRNLLTNLNLIIDEEHHIQNIELMNYIVQEHDEIIDMDILEEDNDIIVPDMFKNIDF